MKLPKIITHKNMGPILDAIAALPCYQCGAPLDLEPPAWVHQLVILEVPAGELCESGLKTMALKGRNEHAVCDLDGKEGFNAQGLEGKVRIRKDLFGAIMNLRDLIAPFRGRIVVG